MKFTVSQIIPLPSSRVYRILPSTPRPLLTCLLVGVSAARLPKSHHGPEVSSQHGPAESGHRVDSHQAADEGVLAALQQGHNVRTHVVGVLLPEVLNEDA